MGGLAADEATPLSGLYVAGIFVAPAAVRSAGMPPRVFAASFLGTAKHPALGESLPPPIFFWRYRFKMLRINASRHKAEVINRQAVGDRSNERLVGNTMGALAANLVVDEGAGVAALRIRAEPPNPAGCGKAAILGGDPRENVCSNFLPASHGLCRPRHAAASCCAAGLYVLMK